MTNRRPAAPTQRQVAELPTLPGEVRYFKTRLTKGGPHVPARIWIVDGERDPETRELLSDQRLAYQIGEFAPAWANDWWPRGWPWTPIEPHEWQYLTDLQSWARQHDPSHPLADPLSPIDRATAPTF